MDKARNTVLNAVATDTLTAMGMSLIVCVLRLRMRHMSRLIRHVRFRVRFAINRWWLLRESCKTSG